MPSVARPHLSGICVGHSVSGAELCFRSRCLPVRQEQQIRVSRGVTCFQWSFLVQLTKAVRFKNKLLKK